MEYFYSVDILFSLTVKDVNTVSTGNMEQYSDDLMLKCGCTVMKPKNIKFFLLDWNVN